MSEQIDRQRKDSRTRGRQVAIENSFPEQRNNRVHKKAGSHSKRQQERRRRRRRRKRIQQIMTCLIVILAILCVILVIRHKTVVPNSVAELDSDSKSTAVPASPLASTPDSDNVSNEGYDILVGIWDIDGITKYRFDGIGQGALLVSAGEHIFTYTIDGNKLLIDFTEEDIQNTEFRFQLDGDTLTLLKEGRTRTIETILHKQE